MRKKKRRTTTYTFVAHPYSVDVCVIMGETLADAGVRLAKFIGKDQEVPKTAAAMTYNHRSPSSGKQIVFVLFDYRAKKHPDLVVHEAIHAVNFIYYAKGVEWDLCNDEPHAYMVSQMVCTINHALKNAR